MTHTVAAKGPPGRWTIAAVLATIVLALSALHVWWLHRFRDGFSVDIDESGYLWFAYHLHDVLQDDGLVGMWERFQGEGWVGPLLPIVTALVEALGGTSEIVHSMAVQLLFFAVLVLSSYGIGRRLLDWRAGLLTAVVVATLPAVTDFVRTYHLVMPTTAMYALATYALLESDRLRRRGWMIVWGFALGLTLLSRSMAIAFLPALPLAAGWMLVVDRPDRRRILNLSLGLGVFLLVALQWYASTWRPIFDYLVSFGYGEETPGRGVSPSPVSLGYWTDELIGTIDVSLYLPLASVFAAAFLVVLVSRAPAALRAAGGARPLAGRAARSEVLVPVFVVVEGYLALTSSSNDGTGFVVPLLPAVAAL
ncbi:MAG: ArnT family glycosyltransferase, partial [Gaiellaceae bacterium]